MWKLSPETQEDAQQLYSILRRPVLLSNTRNTCQIIADLAARNEPGAIPAIAGGLFSRSSAVGDAAANAIGHLLNYTRRNLGEVVSAFIDLMILPKNRELLKSTICCNDKKTNRRLVKLALERPGNHRQAVVELALESTDNVLRLHGAQAAHAVLPQKM